MKKQRKQAEKLIAKLDQIHVEAPPTQMEQTTYQDCGPEKDA